MEEALTWKDVAGLVDELRAMARRLLRSEAQAHSLRPSELMLT
ncbi:MAG: hypothetical protein FD130_1863, partial [Halothiobacillaceae bacterium]